MAGAPCGFNNRCSAWFRACAPRPPVHRTEHLHVAHRIEAEALRDAFRHDLQQPLQRALGVLGLDEKTITLPRLAERGHVAGVDRVGGEHDAALGRLPMDLGETRHGDTPGVDHVCQHLARTDRWQLVDVADKQHAHRVGHRL